MKFAKLVKAMSAAGRMDSDDILERIGLERRRSVLERVLTIAGIFGAGIVVGAGVGMLASPVAPADARKKIGQGVNRVKDEIGHGVSRVKEEIGQGVRSVKHELHEGIRHARHEGDGSRSLQEEVLKNGATR